MEKITEKLLLEKGSPKTNKLEQIKTLNLSRLGLKCQDLPAALLCRLTSLERLDLSGNCLKELPRGLLLPALSSLDLSNNEMEDVTTLESLVSMEELKMEDNLYITVNDNYKLMVLLPNLRIFNGKDISTTANHMRYVYSENLRTRVVAVWGSNFSLPDPPTKEKMAALERDFVKTARLQVKFGPNSISDYTRWRVERIAKEYLRSLTEPKEQDEDTGEATDTQKHCSVATPVKRKASTVTGSDNVSLTPRKITRTDPQSPLAEASPRKSSRFQLTPESQSTGAPATRGRGAARKAVQAPLTPKAVQAPLTPKAVQAPLTPKEVQAPLTPRRSSKKQQPEERHQQQAKDCVMEPDKDVQATVLQTDVASPRKLSCRKMEERLSLKPTHVLQCHGKQDSREDFTTQLWACAFQPSLQGQESSTATGDAGGSRMVATCGGDTVCLIDCETGLVMKKYKVPGEELFSLAWSTVLMSKEGGGGVLRTCSILAVAGKRGLVKLIHPRANVAYGEFRASRKALSVLHFSPRQGNFLFTGSYDHKIVLWDIGGVDSQYNYKVIQLLVLETTATPLHICLPPNSPTTHLLSACEDGLLCYNIQLDKNTMKRSAEMEITFPIYKQEDKDHNYHTIDSLRFLTDDILASKSYMQSSIYLWSWSKTQAQRHNKRTTVVCAVVLAELKWANTEIPYLALNTCPREAVVVCGDDKGQLWTYHVTNLLKAKIQSGSPVNATEVLKWPSPVLTDRGPVAGPTINNVAMDPDLRYLVALTDKNMVVVWKRADP